MFHHIETYAGDPILSLMEAFKTDTRAGKVNLSIGLCYNEQGMVQALESVETMRRRYLENSSGPSLYLPMDGLAGYCHEIQKLIFGAESPLLAAQRIATIQTIGGSGALKIGADFLFRWFPHATVWVSNPTWENHVSIFQGAGFNVFSYPYFDDSTGMVNLQAMLDCLSDLTRHSIVLLHPCCHNPSGADLTGAEWDRVIAIVKERELIPFFDMAYQGFGRGLDEDCYAIRTMARHGMLFLVSNSFSKIFSLYGERVGGLSIVCDDAATTKTVQGQLQATVRRNYSSPPSFGAQLVNGVLSNPDTRLQWSNEVERMRLRIEKMRQLLFDQLIELGADPDRFRYLLTQKGMFTLTPYRDEQIRALRHQSAIYMVENGRMCVAGLNEQNLSKVAEALLQLEYAK